MVLDPSSEFFKYLRSSNGGKISHEFNIARGTWPDVSVRGLVAVYCATGLARNV